MDIVKRLGMGIAGIGLAAIIVNRAATIYNDNWSDEATHAHTVAAAKAQLEARQNFEANGDLGTQWSVVSSNGWAVKHPLNEPGITFTPHQDDADDMLLRPSDQIKFDDLSGLFNGTGDTRIYVNEYTKLDGSKVPELQIYAVDSNRNYTYYDYLLEDKPVDGEDTSTIVFAKLDDKDTHERYYNLYRSPKTEVLTYGLHPEDRFQQDPQK